MAVQALDIGSTCNRPFVAVPSVWACRGWVVEGCTVQTITVTLDLPVYAPLSSTVRALEVARDAQADPKAKQALAMATALASRGLVETLAKLPRPRLRTP